MRRIQFPTVRAPRISNVDLDRVSPPPDGTLVAALHTFAIRHVPARFYIALQLAAPAAIQCWAWGWRRAAASMVLVSAFGVWALCEQKLEQVGDTDMGNPKPGILFRMVQRTAGILAGVMAAGLLFELFIRFMSLVFRCPGCAG